MGRAGGEKSSASGSPRSFKAESSMRVQVPIDAAPALPIGTSTSSCRWKEVFLPDGIAPDGWALAFFFGFMLGAIAMYFTGVSYFRGK